MADYTLTGYTGPALEAKLAKIDEQGAKLDTIQTGANNYILPQATRSQLGGMVAYATATTMPVWYGRVYINSQTGMAYVPLATDNYAGALSPTDYGKLKLIWPDCTNIINKIETIKVDGTAIAPDTNKVINIDLSGKVDNDYAYSQVKSTADWCERYILRVGDEHSFLDGKQTDDTYEIGWMRDGFAYTYSVKIPLISDTSQGLVDKFCYDEYLQPLLRGDIDERIYNLEHKLNEILKSLNAQTLITK